MVRRPQGTPPGGEPGAAGSEELSERYAPYVVSPVLVGDRRSAGPVSVIIELNLDHPDGVEGAREKIVRLLLPEIGAEPKRIESRPHVFVELTREQIRRLVEMDAGGQHRAIYKIWPDRKLEAFLDRSVKTIKAEASMRAFGSDGAGIVWAVIDSGVEGDHPHFASHANLMLQAPAGSPKASQTLRLDHCNYTNVGTALTDEYGHGTHVAGILAGETPWTEQAPGERRPRPPGAARLSRRRTADNSVRLYHEEMSRPVHGVAPRCKILSLKVLDGKGSGDESSLLAALDYVSRLNDDGRLLRVHGVNISIGYGFEAEWFAAGQSPACVAVDRLVRTGVVVVAAAGNEGSILVNPEGASASKRVGLDQSIADPGNAERAITVGSTHPESPHTFGVSYFSSRGPTADGRVKPDLVAPGERILSCASRTKVEALAAAPELETQFKPKAGVAYYREESGTSMAAPHVSGAAAAFLSVHREFIGQPERVKEILLASATNLKRKPDFQGAGLVDLLRAIQSV